MDRTAYKSQWKNLHSWAGHLRATIEGAVTQAMVELGPPGDETLQDVRGAADALETIAGSLGDVMNAYDLLLEAAGRPRRYDDFLQGLGGTAERESPADDDADDEALAPEINRSQFARLAAELHFDSGWLMGAIHGAMIGDYEDLIDEHLDGLATGIEEFMISYDRLQDLIGVMPARHCAFFDQMVILEEDRRHRPRPH